MSLRPLDGVEVGDQVPTVTYRVRRVDLVRYAGAGGDFNVIHWSERRAVAVGLPTVIAHGMYTMALGGRYVAEWAGDTGAVTEYGVRFTGMVEVPDDDDGAAVEFSGRVTGRDDASRTVTVLLTAVCAGIKVLGRATAVVRLG